MEKKKNTNFAVSSVKKFSLHLYEMIDLNVENQQYTKDFVHKLYL